jgi:hypothetical protein
MGRSVNYLNRAKHVSYFEWPSYTLEDEYESEFYEDSEIVIDDIRESIKSEFPEFDNEDKWDGRETHIILSGYGVEIGLSEYCGLASLSIRVEDDTSDDVENIESWIDANWDNISLGYNMYRKVGTFSNGESIYESK